MRDNGRFDLVPWIIVGRDCALDRADRIVNCRSVNLCQQGLFGWEMVVNGPWQHADGCGNVPH